MSSGSDAPDPTYSGQDRVAWLWSVALQLARHGLAPETIGAALHEENVAKCRPPLAVDELQQLAGRAVVYAATEEGHRSDAFERFARRIDLLDDGDLESLPPLTWLVENMIPSQSLTLMYASPGVGKTFVALDLAFCVQIGVPWQNTRVRKGKVIYVVGEGGAGMSLRVRAWKQSRDVQGVAGLLFHRGPLDVMKPDQLSAFIDRVGPENPSLVVVDTLARCMGGDEDSAKDMGAFIEGLERLRTTLRATVMTLHHPTKNHGAERGSGALRGAMDTVLRLSVSQRVIEMRCEKQKDAEEFPHIYASLQPVDLLGTGKSCVVVPSLPPQLPIRAAEGDDGVGRATARHRRNDKARVLALLAHASGGMTPSQIRAELPDVKESTLFRRLKQLRDEGAVEADSGVYHLRARQAVTLIPLSKDGSESGSDT